jgi:hypothetical protein
MKIDPSRYLFMKLRRWNEKLQELHMIDILIMFP